MRVYLPAPYTSTLAGRALAVARPGARELVLEALAHAGSLFRFAERQTGATRLEGRGPAYAIPAADGRWVVRHFRRGGAFARLLGDRYLAVGMPRPVAELLASDIARGRGVDTPEVQALVIYPAGAFYRADIATAHVPDSIDLARALFGPAPASAEERVRACSAAGRLLAILAERGVVHADLNLKNILLAPTTAGFRPYLLDLDRSRIVTRVSGRQRETMLQRFWRSISKWEARIDRPLTATERAAFEAGYAGGTSAAPPPAVSGPPLRATRGTRPAARDPVGGTGTSPGESLHVRDA